MHNETGQINKNENVNVNVKHADISSCFVLTVYLML